MLFFRSDKARERQLRLLACGVARRAWSLIIDEEGRNTVEVTERYLEGLIPKDQWDEDHGFVTLPGQEGRFPQFWNDEGLTAAHALAVDTVYFAVQARSE